MPRLRDAKQTSIVVYVADLQIDLMFYGYCLAEARVMDGSSESDQRRLPRPVKCDCGDVQASKIQLELAGLRCPI